MRHREHIEIWKHVLGYEGWYEISDLGRVRRFKTGRILKLNPDHKGYLKCNLCRYGKMKVGYAHIMVCEAFHGPRPSRKHEVNHKDEIKKNNYDTNLEWLTKSQNVKYSIHGRKPRRKPVIFVFIEVDRGRTPYP